MTSAEFKTRREALSLSSQWFAERLGVRLRTVQYWEASKAARGGKSPPEDAIRLLLDLELKRSNIVERGLRVLKEKSQEFGVNDVELYRFPSTEDLIRAHRELDGLTAAFHAGALLELKKIAEKLGFSVQITYNNQ